MRLSIDTNTDDLGTRASALVAESLRNGLAQRKRAAIVLATGMSQFPLLERLAVAPDVDWSRVHIFHMDEYMGLDSSHSASFVRFLLDRFVNHIPKPAAFHGINGMAADPAEECRRLEALIRADALDVTVAGVGNTGHLAFNDPPADFDTDVAYHVVDLLEGSRRQQLDQGWFPTMDAVPKRAFSISIRQVLRSGRIVCLAHGEHKRNVVQAMVEGPLTPMMPASALRVHGDCRLLVDESAAGGLSSISRVFAEAPLARAFAER